MGAAFATLLSYFVMAASIFIANQRIYPVSYDYLRIGILLVILTVVLILYYIIPLPFLIRILIMAVVPVILYVTGFFKPRELAAFKSVFKR